MPAVLRSRVASTLFATIAVLCCGVAAAQLNRTVTVLSKATTPVPAGCEEGLAPARAPRVEHEVTRTKTAEPPPHNELTAAMQRVQRAAEGDDRETFTSALADARATVANYPSGGEKQKAEKSLQIYADIDRLWSYAESSPTGAFFDAKSDDGALLPAVKRYPGWSAAIADSTITSGGTTFYPTRETRQFLARLAKSGMPAPAPVAIRHETKTAAVAPAPKHPRKPETKIAAATPAPRHHHKKKEVKVAAVAAKPAAAAPAPAPPSTNTVAAPPVAAPTQTATTAPAPATITTQPTTTTQEPVTTTTAAPPPQTLPPTETSVTAAPTTSSAQPPAQPAQGKSNVNMIVAIILVIIGVGMAIVLFRASD